MSEEPRRFRRIGQVTAVVMQRPRTWTTEGGDTLRGEAGDWLVTSHDGGERTVREEQFRASYEHVAGDTWRRTGEVSAWRTETDVQLMTLEGPAVAKPGDWIVRADDGSTWPVPDPVFRATYAAAEDG